MASSPATSTPPPAWCGPAPTARRASYRLRQAFRYEYQEPITDLNHRLVMIPPARFGDQRRTYHDLLVELKEIRMQNREDRFGNVVIDVFAPEVQEAIEFVAEASVERWAAEPNIIAGGWPAAGYLLEVTPLTTAPVESETRPMIRPPVL